MDWFYAENKTQIGPISEEKFLELVKTGEIKPDTLVWHMGMTNWQTHSSVLQKTRPPNVVEETPAAPEESDVTQRAEKSKETAEEEGAGRAEETDVSKETLEVKGAVGESEGTGEQEHPETADHRPPLKTCAECNLPVKENEGSTYRGEWVCNVCRPMLAKKMKADLNAAGVVEFAGLLTRLIAKMIDGIILWLFGLLCVVLAGPVLPSASQSHSPSGQNVIVYSLLYIVLAAGYTTFFLGRFGATPGKMSRRMKVVDDAGGRIGYGKAFARFLGELCSMVLIGTGYFLAAFDKQKRTLHDRIANTRVVN